MISVNDRLVSEAISHAVDLDQYGTGVVRRMLALLNRVDADLFAQLTAALVNLDAESFTVERLEALLMSVRTMHAQAYLQLDRALTNELREFVAAEWGYQQQLLPSVGVPLSFGTGVATAEQVYAAAMSRPFQGRLLSEWASGIEAQRMTRIRDAVRIGFVENESVQQIVRRVRGTRAAGYSDGLIEIDRRHAEAVVRTAVQHVAAVAQDRMIEANLDLIKAVQWHAKLDLRTSPTCFPGSTGVLPAGDLRGVSRRVWNGYLVVVTTASGKKLRATPNHPVLTARGWRPIKELHPGADVLYRVGVDVGAVSPAEDIKMPASIGAIFDALSEPAFGDVSVERTAEIDFHGDGIVGDHEINYPRSKSDLRIAFESAFGNEVAEQLFVFVAPPGGLPAESELDEICVSSGLVNVPAEIGARSFENSVKPALADSTSSANGGRFHPALEEGNELALIRSALMVAATKGRHASGALQYSGDSGRGGAEAAADGCGRFSAAVTADDVVSLEREFFSGHVFNLSTSTEVYIADGFIVHNCRVRDGLLYTPDTHKPIGHKVPWLSGPGRSHWNCRSLAVQMLKSFEEVTGIAGVGEIPVGTRASMDGALPADLTYGQWLQKQSAARQDEVVGPTRGALMREGKLPFDELYSRRGEMLTLDQLRERNGAAFKRAGV